MSRAFVKDGDDRPEPAIKRAVGDRPNPVTAAGLDALRAALARALEAGDERNAAYFEQRIASARLVGEEEHSPGVVTFGATVSARDESGKVTRVRIVGEDEADPAHGSISWSSPFARAMLEHRVGENVIVHRPAGSATLTIVAVEY